MKKSIWTTIWAVVAIIAIGAAVVFGYLYFTKDTSSTDETISIRVANAYIADATETSSGEQNLFEKFGIFNIDAVYVTGGETTDYYEQFLIEYKNGNGTQYYVITSEKEEYSADFSTAYTYVSGSVTSNSASEGSALDFFAEVLSADAFATLYEDDVTRITINDGFKFVMTLDFKAYIIKQYGETYWNETYGDSYLSSGYGITLELTFDLNNDIQSAVLTQIDDGYTAIFSITNYASTTFPVPSWYTTYVA